jgi:hypothetical protein
MVLLIVHVGLKKKHGTKLNKQILNEVFVMFMITVFSRKLQYMANQIYTYSV